MKKCQLLIFVLFVFVLTNCSDDNNVLSPQPTVGEINAAKLQQYVDKTNPRYASAYVYDFAKEEWIKEESEKFQIEAPFISINDVFYNLEYLFKFEKYNEELRLYFKE